MNDRMVYRLFQLQFRIFSRFLLNIIANYIPLLFCSVFSRRFNILQT